MRPRQNKETWTALCERLGEGESAAALWHLLDALYRHPRRFYHTIEHAADCVQMLHDLHATIPADDPDAAELALWLHDCIYVSGSKVNEEESAEVAKVFCVQLGLNDERTDRVVGMIMATRHLGLPLKGDEALVADIDLSSLGSKRADFARGSASIAREFSHVPADAYRAGRVKFLEAMLSRPRLFHTEHMHALLEAAARRNVRIELERQLARETPEE
ncbi:MAG: hypothetical protein AB7K52_07935 [Phycisphaerales bacterium]